LLTLLISFGDHIKEAIVFNALHVLKEESGQGLTEYALIIALIAIAAVASVTLFGGSLTAYFQGITDTIGAV
jgi:pilus assembly protein Flp/PilA